jgi:hypothetical protein
MAVKLMLVVARFRVLADLDRIGDRALEAHPSMRSIAERLRVRVTAAAKPDVVTVENDLVSLVIDDGHRARYMIRAVAGHLYANI